MSDIAVNTYIKGLNQDVSRSKYSPDSYYDASNIRVTTVDGLSTLSLSNESGNSLCFKIPTVQAVYKLTISGVGSYAKVTINGYTVKISNNEILSIDTITQLYDYIISNSTVLQQQNLGHYKVFNRLVDILIVGLDEPLTVTTSLSCTTIVVSQATNDARIISSTTLRDNLILFTTSSTTVNPVNGDGQIWKIPINPDGSVSNLTSQYLTPSIHLVNSNNLNFSAAHKIDAYGNYETSEVGKVYFTDYNNPFRHINILSPNVLALPASDLSIVPEVTFGPIAVNNVIMGGNYKSGMVQYAYQYYNLHGAQSSFSAPTGLVHLTDKSETLADTRLYGGAAKDVKVGKSVQVTLTNLDHRFTHIKVVALFYDVLEGIPTITIVHERTMPASGAFTFVDDGTHALGSFTPEEYTAIGSVDFKCKTFTTKDNIMLPANLVEDYYNVDKIAYWDSRAYRFTNETDQTAVLTSSDSLSSITVRPTTWNTIVPQTHDCIQAYDNQLITTDPYKYTTGTTRYLGGDGPNISYRFKVEPFIEDDAGYTVNTTSLGVIHPAIVNGEYTNYASINMHSNKVGYRRGEMYRFGIVFKDAKGRWSFVKWIADIQMPFMHTTTPYANQYTYYSNSEGWKRDFNIFFKDGNELKMNILYLEFTVKSMSAEAVGYQIVRMKREEWDKRVLTQGALLGTSNLTADGVKRPPVYFLDVQYSVINNTYHSHPVLFYSPEVSFNRQLFQHTNIVPVAGMSLTFGKVIVDGPSDTFLDASKVSALSTLHAPGAKHTPTTIQRILIGSSETQLSIDGINYKHYRNTGDLDSDNKGYAGVALALNFSASVGNELTRVGSDFSTQVYLVNLQNDLSSQYGGNSYSNRFDNAYIACGPYRTTTGTFNVYGGDTFLGMFDLLYGFVDIGADDSFAEVVYFPCESDINLALRHDSCFHRLDIPGSSVLIQEKAGTHDWGGGNTPTYQPTDLYLYNNVYSRQNSVKEFYSKPLNFSENQTFDTRTMASQVKHINEEIDSWTTYLAAQFIDIDATYGPINKVVTFNNKVVFLQDSALGLLSVNDRALMTTDETGTGLTLGRGGILDEAVYISRHSGCHNKDSVVMTPNGIYYFDALHLRFNLFSDKGNLPLGELKGMASFFKGHSMTSLRSYDVPLLGYGIHATYDIANNRVLTTFLDNYSANEFTIAYNELMESFESLYDYKPRLYLTIYDHLYSVDPSPSNKYAGFKYQGEVYQHNAATAHVGMYYDEVHDSYITILVNKDPMVPKIYTNLQFDMLTIPDSSDALLHSIRLQTDYQDTGNVYLNNTNSRKRARLWHYTIPRADPQIGGVKDRIRGPYAFVTLNYDNSTNYKFVLGDLLTYYIPSVM